MVFKIFITFNCNLNCKYCFVIHKHVKMRWITLEKILKLALENKNVKKIILTGGEPTSNFELIKKAGIFIKKNDFARRIVFDDIPTNGTLLNKEMIEFAKDHSIKFAFSLDGYGFSQNVFRYKDKRLYGRILLNLHNYIRITKKIPRVKMTVNPQNSHLLYENVVSLLSHGLVNIQILAAFGQLWANKTLNSFLNSFKKVLTLHKYLKSQGKSLTIDPIDWYITKIKTKSYAEITMSSCDMGDEISFDPSGEAYACLSMIHLRNNPSLKKKFYIGNIHNSVDIKKIRSFEDYRICSNTKLNCKHRFPNISCKKICATLDFKTGKTFKSGYIENLLAIENSMFEMTYQKYFKNRLSNIYAGNLPHPND
ncbi:MAG: hypothetical protein COV72_06695 [Candidatus Omnitrophica bacterium CG11_big_fil_rev_8_21_14_0_20_42_13]|uniref:Radical SAM core domain-containing protein n=1 Tax=Candidatus Ghiorseimicrobium undicola TaxID=1974746 RepID=A0A2H0LZ33_9BACT|nr:MAG: hypothetical protein COV72_06695 [Candidatus Omnitrophica bacterium CG11_big_fil_rev_8_21_14_0_20_42_13]